MFNHRLRSLALALSLAATACAGGVEPPDSVCRQAADHLTACTGSSVAPAASCEGEAELFAQQALTTSCDALGQRAKTDALSNPISMAACLALGIPLFVTGGAEDEACCFDHNCGSGLSCRKHTCQPRAAAGSACERNAHCKSGLACVFGKCAMPRAKGQSCQDPGDCVAGLTCGPKKTCATPGATGASCSENSHCADRCIAGRCAAGSGEGGACDSGDDFDCELGLVCVKSQCAPRPASGGACDASSPFQCEMDETCWEGRCEARHAKSEACSTMHDCVFGLFCIQGVCAEL